MGLAAIITSFVIILPAELPDKTVIACLVLGSRYRPAYVFAGAAAAFAIQVALAVTAGGLLSLLPHQITALLRKGSVTFTSLNACSATTFSI